MVTCTVLVQPRLDLRSQILPSMPHCFHRVVAKARHSTPARYVGLPDSPKIIRADPHVKTGMGYQYTPLRSSCSDHWQIPAVGQNSCRPRSPLHPCHRASYLELTVLACALGVLAEWLPPLSLCSCRPAAVTLYDTPPLAEWHQLSL